jgi:hypothetical protein
MGDVQDDGVRLGLLGPWRRWRSWAPRERVGVAAVWLVGGIGGGLISWVLSPVFGDDEGVGGAVFFAVWITVFMVYMPELTHLWRKIDDDS